jgi:DNA-binding response OmpR family regulator
LQWILKKQSIMVIYNNLDMFELLNDGLKDDGYDTIIAVNEEEAVAMLDKVTPDMVIMDTVTADAHSLHIMDTIKNKTKVLVVVITPDNDIYTLKKLFDHGADDLVYKPLNMRILSARLHAILRRWCRFPEDTLFPQN